MIKSLPLTVLHATVACRLGVKNGYNICDESASHNHLTNIGIVHIVRHMERQCIAYHRDGR